MPLASSLALALLAGCGDKDTATDTGAVATDDTSSTADDTSSTGDDTGETGDTELPDPVGVQLNTNLVVCEAEGQWLCPQVKWGGKGEWEKLPCGIDGLDYDWGTTYQLAIVKTGTTDPAADGCGDQYELVEVIMSDFVAPGEATDMVVWDVLLSGDGLAGAIDGWPMTCDTPELCEELSEIESEWTTSYAVSVKNPLRPGDPVVLASLEAL